MKRMKMISVILLCTLLLSSCGIKRALHGLTLVGSWHGDGTFDIVGIDAPFEFATELAFHEDGTLTAMVNDEALSYHYSATDDTITIQGEDMSWGVYYTVKGTSLSLKTGSDDSVFTKSK